MFNCGGYRALNTGTALWSLFAGTPFFRPANTTKDCYRHCSALGPLSKKPSLWPKNKNGLMCWINAISARLSGYRENTAPRLPKLQGRLTARWNSEGREGSGVASAKLSRYLCLPGGMSSMVACVVVLHFSRAGRPLELFPFFRPPAASPLPLSHFHRCTGTCMF